MPGVLFGQSDFSIGESLIKAKKLPEIATEHGYPAVALCDTMTVSGLIQFTQACKKAEVKPIIGVRLRIVDDPTLREKKVKNPAWYPKLFVLKEAGLKAIYRLLTRANDDDRFYMHARLGWSDFFEVIESVEEGALAFATGDVLSTLRADNARHIVRRVSCALGASQTFCELVPVGTPVYDKQNRLAIELAEDLGCETLLTWPALYNEGQADSLDVLNALGRNVKIDATWANKPWTRDQHPRSFKELIEIAAAAKKRIATRYPELDQGLRWPNAVKAQNNLAAAVEYEWAKADVCLPKMAPDEHAAVVEQCKLGWKERFAKPVFGHQPDKSDLAERYKPRLQYELRVLKDLGFSGYFLLVQEIVKWSKDNGIRVGPGRGSVGGSLVAYLMGITDIDPIRFDLLFERFINPSRIDLPDADLDFMSNRRHEVFEFISRRWGEENVAGITNYTELGSASAIRDVGRTFDMDPRDLSCSKLVPEEHGQPVSLEEACAQVGEIETFAKTRPEVWRHALALEGVMRSLGQHAAGIVAAAEPLVERAVVERRKGSRTINWDKRVCEDQGLVKIDVLGLSTLDLIEEALSHIKERHGKTPDLTGLPLDDPKVMDAFGRGDTVGVFQFESGGMRKLLKDLAQSERLTFNDVTAATALYRPGPMDSGMLESYVARKNGLEEVSYDFPEMEEPLADTYGVVVYQEQVMKLAQVLAGFSLPEADKLRKAMGKKDKDLMVGFKEQWIKGCVDTVGMKESKADDLFEQIAAFAGYGFNKSHAAEYSLISYQSMWLKVYYPVEFYAASLTILKENKLAGLIADAEKRKIVVQPPDINISTHRFEVLNDTTLAIPFNRCKGISDNTTNAILAARKDGSFADVDDFLARVEKRKCNKRHQDVLRRVGAFARIDEDELPALHPDRLKDQIELMPGLMNRLVVAERLCAHDRATKRELMKVVQEYQDKAGDAPAPMIQLGKAPKFMVITDCPTWAEEQSMKISVGKTFGPVSEALSTNGLSRADGYFTCLSKVVKEGKFVSDQHIKDFGPILMKEVALLKPPVIVLLGSAAARYFVKDLKGGLNDHAGKVQFDVTMDASLVLGINPLQVAFDEGKQAILDDVFSKVAEMVL